MSENTIYSVCGMCGVRCPIEVNVEDGRCRSIQGNRHAAGIRGALCVRGAAGIACVQDDERPQFPMLRKGGRGEGNWQRISWEEALDYTAGRIKEIVGRDGPDVFSAFGSGRITNENNYAIMKFTRAAIKTNNVDHCART
jgi:thiosulfate reductase/polysulfide reductase chain A